jgi:hypothetical protein
MTQSRFNAFLLSLFTMRHRGLATLAAAMIGLVAAGCGSGGGGDRISKAQYEQHFRSDSQAISEGIKPLTTKPSSLKQLSDELKVGEKRLHEAADDLDSIKPPKDIEKDNDTIVKGLDKFADELESFRKAAEKQDVKLLQQTFAELQGSHALVNVRDATEDMKKKGYKLGTLAQ